MATEKQLLETWEQAIEDALQDLNDALQESDPTDSGTDIMAAITKLSSVKQEIW